MVKEGVHANVTVHEGGGLSNKPRTNREHPGEQPMNGTGTIALRWGRSWGTYRERAGIARLPQDGRVGIDLGNVPISYRPPGCDYRYRQSLKRQEPAPCACLNVLRRRCLTTPRRLWLCL